jgi:hypothetical protein
MYLDNKMVQIHVLFNEFIFYLYSKSEGVYE